MALLTCPGWELGQAGSSHGASLCAPVEGQHHPQRGLPTAPQLPTLGLGTMPGPGAKGMSLCNLPGCVRLAGTHSPAVPRATPNPQGPVEVLGPGVKPRSPRGAEGLC